MPKRSTPDYPSPAQPAKIVKVTERPLPAKTIYDNFKQGDLIFGLLSETTPVIKELRKRNFTHIIAQDLNDTTIEDLYHNKRAFLELPKHKHRLYLINHRDYLFKSPQKPLPHDRAKKSNWPISGAYRRSCKLLICNRHPKRAYVSHVVLKNVDWDRVFNKKNADGSINDGITNSELRAAYRDYCNHGVHPWMKFYNEKLMELDAPPWDTCLVAGHALNYEQQRLAKLAADIEIAMTPIPLIKPLADNFFRARR